MKKILLIMALMTIMMGSNAEEKIIRIGTENTDLVLMTNTKGRLYQVYLGSRLQNIKEVKNIGWQVYRGSDGSYPLRGNEVYAGNGSETFFEPALAVTHNDGNLSTYLYFQSSEQKAVPGGTETIIRMKDDKYPVDVTLHYVAYNKENVIKAWSEISHQEKAPVTLWRYYSTMLYFNAPKYYLTSYHSDWAKEAQPQTQLLPYGKTVIDTKLGSRSNMVMDNFFALGIDGEPNENHGTVMLGTTNWTGNFRNTFEVDNAGRLTVLPGINPYASDYQLKRGETFTTPEFVFTLSENGTSEATRNLHAWARQYQIALGHEDRMTLLNNWENTGCNFDEPMLADLMVDAKKLGVDMFLLDDGWFANKYPRKDDHAGLGDWEPTKTKLPNGLKGLTNAARKAGVKFGLWIEPEMVNPKSELFEKHPDWAIHLPNRELYYYRNQLVLDLSNPKVQDYVFSVVDNIMKEAPEIVYFKWDCNSPITNVYSAYLGKNQGNLYIDYVRGLYNVCERIKAKYPKLRMMLCSGGGGRMDYKALDYFSEFWASDNTDPYERIYIQWNVSRFFPAKAIAAHVTNWNKHTSVKFRTDVASSMKLGFDIDLKSLSADEYKYMQQAVKNYNGFKHIILDGDQYRLISPNETDHCALNYVSKDKQQAVLFVYDLHPRYKEPLTQNVKLQGLDAAKIYTVRETNLMPGKESTLDCNGKQYSGDYLMKVGINVLSDQEGTSRVITLE